MNTTSASNTSDSKKSEDWRNSCKNIPETWSKAWKKGMFVDVHFSVGKEGSRKQFSAHKILLAFGCPVFEAMFFGKLSEKQNPIVIPDDDPEAFEAMLKYLYGENALFTSVPVAYKTYSLGDKYLLPHLQAEATNYISSFSINDAIFWDIVESDLFFSAAFEDRCRSYISEHTEALLKSDSFLKIPENIVELIVQMEDINIGEFELLMAVTRWCDKKYKGKIYSSKNFLKFLGHIRYSVLTMEEFCKFDDIWKNVIDPESSSAIMKHIHKSTYNLPSWCTAKGPRRNRCTVKVPSSTFGNPYCTRRNRKGNNFKPDPMFDYVPDWASFDQ